jgi:hypothetical protein
MITEEEQHPALPFGTWLVSIITSKVHDGYIQFTHSGHSMLTLHISAFASFLQTRKYIF